MLNYIIVKIGVRMIARTSKERRGWIAWHYANGQNISRTCREFGIARATLYKWLDRYDPDRPSKPLLARSRRPHKTKQKTWGRFELDVVSFLDMETGGRLGAVRMTQALARKGLTDYSRATVGRILAAINEKCPICDRKGRNHVEWFHRQRADYERRFIHPREDLIEHLTTLEALYSSGHKQPDVDAINSDIKAARKTKLRLGT